MTDRAAAARPGGPGSGAAGAASTVMPGCHRQARGSAACRQRAPGLSRCTRAAIAACPPLVNAPRAHCFWVSLIDGPGSESRLDIVAVNVRLIYALLRRGVWTIPFFLHARGVDRALPGEGPVTGAARQHNPQHFPNVRTGPVPFHTSDPHGCAQQAGKTFSCPAGRRSGSACRCLREGPARRMPDLAWMTSPKKAGTGCSPHTPWHAQAARAQSPPTPVPHRATPTTSRSARRGPHRRPGSAAGQPATADAGRWPGGVSLLSRPLANAGRRQAGQQHLPGRATRRLAARSPVTTRSFACARVTTAPRPPRSLAVLSGISGRPVWPGRRCSRDDAAPGLAG